MKKTDIFLVGIGGGSASGKTTFVRELSKKIGKENVCVISQDHYYKNISKQKRDKNGQVNFDHPAGIDFVRLKQDLQKLLRGETVKIVEYTFNNPDIIPEEVVYKPARIVLLEGLFVFADPALNRMYDYRLYMHADHDVARERRLARDIKERNVSEEEVIYQWENHVKPAYEEFLKPHKPDADYIIQNNSNFDDCMKKVIAILNDVILSSD